MCQSSPNDRSRGPGMMEEKGGFPELLLFGGPLQKLGVRLGLARGEAGTFRLGLALGLPAWTVLVAAGFLQGLNFKVFTLEMVGVHVRILLVIPLFFACEAFVAPVIAEFARNLRQSRLVSENDWPALASSIRRQATAETERSFMLRLRGRERRLLNKIENAIERIEQGIFGICEKCGEDIDIRRIEARPVTTMCIECKTLQEEEEKLREG